MASGIFSVNFKSSTGDNGEGLLVVKDGTVNGGDPHYIYQGKVPNESGSFDSEFTVKKWREGNTNITGIDNYTLLARGNIDYEAGTVELNGSVAGAEQIKVSLRGKKLVNAL